MEYGRSIAVVGRRSRKDSESQVTVIIHDIRRGAYSVLVVLMQLQRGLLGLPGVVDAGVVMATPANRDLLAANNLLPDSVSANPDDLLIVVKAESDDLAA